MPAVIHYIDYQMKIAFQLQVKVTRSSNDNGQTWTEASNQDWQDVDELWKVIGRDGKYPTTLEKDQLAFGPSSVMITFSNIPRAVKLNGKVFRIRSRYLFIIELSCL